MLFEIRGGNIRPEMAKDSQFPVHPSIRAPFLASSSSASPPSLLTLSSSLPLPSFSLRSSLVCRVATVNLPIGTEFVTPASFPKCGNLTYPYPVAPLTLPPLTPTELAAEKAEEDLATRFDGQISIAQKKTLLKVREEKRWADFEKMLEESKADAEREAKLPKVKVKGALKAEKPTSGEGSRLGAQFRVGGKMLVGGKLFGKGVEAAAPL